MNVRHSETIIINSEHSIEFGQASWDNGVESIRRRKNNVGGTYDPISSSEIPINSGFIDIGELLLACLNRDKISIKGMLKISFAILKSVIRKIVKQKFKHQ